MTILHTQKQHPKVVMTSCVVPAWCSWCVCGPLNPKPVILCMYRPCLAVREPLCGCVGAWVRGCVGAWVRGTWVRKCVGEVPVCALSV